MFRQIYHELSFAKFAGYIEPASAILLTTRSSISTIGLMQKKHRVFTIAVARVYPFYIEKAEKKGRTKKEVDDIICWLTGYSVRQLESHLKKETDFETFFQQAPRLNPARHLIKGVICGVRIEEIQDPLMREIRYLDKLIDELAKGKALENILRT